MGYCLCVFDSDFDDDHEAEELAEYDIEDFCDLAFFRSSIDCYLGAGRFPTLMRLLDNDAWFPASDVRAPGAGASGDRGRISGVAIGTDEDCFSTRRGGAHCRRVALQVCY